MSDNVVTMPGVQPPVTKGECYDAGVLAALKELVEQVRRGEVTGVCWAATLADDSTMISTSFGHCRMTMVAAAARMHHRLMQRDMDEYN